MKKLFLALILFLSMMVAAPVFGAAITDKSIGGLIVVLEAGATTEMIVGGGGAGNIPVWTTCTGTGAPMREGSPTTTGTMVAAAIDASGTISGNLFTPDAADGADIGSAALEFSDIYLADGSIIKMQNDQSVTLTSSAAGLAISLIVTVGTSIDPDIADGATIGSATKEWTSLYLHDSAVIYGEADQSNTLTSSATGWTANLKLTATTFGYAFGVIDDNSWKGDVITGTAGENVTIGDICYLKSDGKFWMADANVEVEIANFIVMSTASITADASGVFLIRGLLRNDTDFEYTVGEPLWVPEADGLPTATQPADSGDFVKLVGWCGDDKDYVWFDPDQSYGKVN